MLHINRTTRGRVVEDKDCESVLLLKYKVSQVTSRVVLFNVWSPNLIEKAKQLIDEDKLPFHKVRFFEHDDIEMFYNRPPYHVYPQEANSQDDGSCLRTNKDGTWTYGMSTKKMVG